MNDPRLSEFTGKQLQAVGIALNAAMACGLVKDYERGDVNEFFIQVLNAIHIVEKREQISSN
jgi:hypothetical protein